MSQSHEAHAKAQAYRALVDALRVARDASEHAFEFDSMLDHAVLESREQVDEPGDQS